MRPRRFTRSRSSSSSDLIWISGSMVDLREHLTEIEAGTDHSSAWAGTGQPWCSDRSSAGGFARKLVAASCYELRRVAVRFFDFRSVRYLFARRLIRLFSLPRPTIL